MLIKQDASLRLRTIIKNSYAALLLVCISFAPLYGVSRIEPQTITYYLNITDFAESFVEIPTSNVFDPSSTLASSYLAGRAPISLFV